MQQVAQDLGITPGQHEERDFEDGEFKIRPLESVRNREVFALQSLYGDEVRSVNDKLIRLLFFLGALGDAGAGRLHVIIPYLCYARKDRRTKSRDPVSIRYIAQLFESIGIDSITVLDVHNPAVFESAFRCPTLHLSAACHSLIPICLNFDGSTTQTSRIQRSRHTPCSSCRTYKSV